MSDERAPWWTWGFVPAAPLGLLTLVTPWFEADAAPRPHVYTGGLHDSYNAWTDVRIGFICPFFLLLMGCQWFRAARGRSRPPAPGDLRGAGRALPMYLGVRALSTKPGDDGAQASEPWYPFRTGAWMSIAAAAVALAALGLNRNHFKPSYTVFETVDGNIRMPSGTYAMTVHPAIGCWFFLTAIGLFLVFGIVGVLYPVTPWWEQRT